MWQLFMYVILYCTSGRWRGKHISQRGLVQPMDRHEVYRYMVFCSSEIWQSYFKGKWVHFLPILVNLP